MQAHNDPPKSPGKTLTVVLRNDAPMIFCDDSPSYRTARIELTREQEDALMLHCTGHQGTAPLYEAISKVILERKDGKVTSEPNREPLSPGRHLTVIIRDITPLIVCNDSVGYRTIEIELTKEQEEAIMLQWIGDDGHHTYHESISQVILE